MEITIAIFKNASIKTDGKGIGDAFQSIPGDVAEMHRKLREEGIDPLQCQVYNRHVEAREGGGEYDFPELHTPCGFVIPIGVTKSHGCWLKMEEKKSHAEVAAEAAARRQENGASSPAPRQQPASTGAPGGLWG